MRITEFLLISCPFFCTQDFDKADWSLLAVDELRDLFCARGRDDEGAVERGLGEGRGAGLGEREDLLVGGGDDRERAVGHGLFLVAGIGEDRAVEKAKGRRDRDVAEGNAVGFGPVCKDLPLVGIVRRAG